MKLIIEITNSETVENELKKVIKYLDSLDNYV